jgi:hypothetical protein
MAEPSMAPSDIMDDIDQEPVEVDEIRETVEAITKCRSSIERLQVESIEARRNTDSDTLSLLLMRIARANSTLGKHGAFANYIARNADRSARRYRGERVIELSKSMAVNKAEPQAEAESKHLFQVASDAQLTADEATDLCYRTDTFLKMAQSNLSLIKDDIHRG